MPVVVHDNVAPEAFRGGASYRTLVGDELGSTPIRVGIQTSPPGYRTPLHSHPYLETITVLEGQGEAWLQGCAGLIALRPGVTLVVPPHHRHWFRAALEHPLKTYGVHASPHRIVNVHDADDLAAAPPTRPL
jgi:quercetin dioxygenase-like cupin family protein